MIVSVLVNLPNDQEDSFILTDREAGLLNVLLDSLENEYPSWTSLVLTITKS
jgi:hypothetical protein